MYLSSYIADIKFGVYDTTHNDIGRKAL